MQLTQTQSLLGTPLYMSPEQMRSARAVDARTDIWSLGIVLYELLEGRRPFEAESFTEMCVKVAVDPPAPMVNTPPALQQVILRCLAKPPEQRYATDGRVRARSDSVRAGPASGCDARRAHAAHAVARALQLGRQRHRRLQPHAAADPRPASAPVRRTGMTPPAQWSVGSDPAASPWNGKSDPNAQAWRDASAPIPRPVLGREPSAPLSADTMDVRPKRKWPLVLGAVALLGIGGAVAAIAVNSTGEPAHVAAPAPTVQMQPAPTVETPAPDPVVNKVETPPVTNPVVTNKVETPAVTNKVETPKVTRPKQTAKQGTQATSKTIPKKDTRRGQERCTRPSRRRRSRSATRSLRCTTATRSRISPCDGPRLWWWGPSCASRTQTMPPTPRPCSTRA